jgi:Family of unknown function (DUF6056)
VDGSRRVPELLRVALTVSLATLLASYAFVGRYARYEADDFCTSLPPWTGNLWTVERTLYMQWTGRFSTVAGWWLIYQLPANWVPFIPALAISIWLLAAYWMVGQLPSALGLGSSRGVRIVCAEALVALALVLNGGRGQTLYWVNGMVPYLLPLLLFTILVGLVCRVCKRSGRRAESAVVVLFGFFVSFVAAGFSETYLVLQLCLGMIALLGFSMRGGLEKWKAGMVAVSADILGTLTAAAISFSAPGNQTRFNVSPGHEHGVPFYLLETLKADALLSVLVVVPLILAMGIAAGVPALLATDEVRAKGSGPGVAIHVSRKWFFCAGLSTPAVIYVVLFPSVSSYASLPPARVLTVSQFVYVCGLVVWICVASRRVQSVKRGGAPTGHHSSLRGWTAVVIIAVVSALGAAAINLQQLPGWEAYASGWDARNVQVLRAKQSHLRDVVVLRLRDPSGVLSAGPNPHFWVNVCTAEYYGLSSLKTGPREAGTGPRR